MSHKKDDRLIWVILFNVTPRLQQNSTSYQYDQYGHKMRPCHKDMLYHIDHLTVNITSRISQTFPNFLIFPKISALSRKLALAQYLLEKLGEVYTINFLIVM